MMDLGLRDLLAFATAIIAVAASHFRLAGRLAVLESTKQSYATHGDVEVLKAKLDAHRDQFNRIENMLARIEEKLDSKQDK